MYVLLRCGLTIIARLFTAYTHQQSSALGKIGDRLATIDMGQKSGAMALSGELQFG